jgi:beta-lactamase class A
MVANGILDYSSIQSDLTAMITQSDNSAADRLYAIMGKAAPMQDLEVRYGLTQTTTDRGWGTTLTSSADQAKLLNQVIGKQESPLPEAQREVLGTLMKSVVPEQAWGAGTNIPAGWSAAVKNGWYQSVPGDIPPVGLWRINTVGLVSDAVNTPRWILTAYSNEWPSQSAGISAWNDLSALLSGALGK